MSASRAWMVDALCAQIGDTSLFYPTKGGGSAAASHICARCPVAAECLDYALASEPASYRHGIWGGLSPRERAALAGDTTTHHPTDTEEAAA